MDKSRYLLAVDVGTGAGRCFLISLDGKYVFKSYREWSYYQPSDAGPGALEFSAEEFWAILAELIREVIAKSGIRPDRIAAVSSTSQREGFVLLDREGKEIYAGPNLDTRIPSSAKLGLIEKHKEEIYQATGHWPTPMFAPYRLLWLEEKRPNLFKAASRLLLLNDWVLYRLSGETYSEPSNAAETLLFDIKNLRWDRDLIEKLGLPPDIFPEIARSGDQIGVVTAEAAKETGLRAGTPVVIGGADTQCALLGTGAIKDGDLSIVLGTFAPQQIVLPEPVIDANYRVWSGCHVVPNKWILESSAMEAGQVFRWAREFMFPDSSGEYELMDKEAALAPKGAQGVRAFLGPRILKDYRELVWDMYGGIVMPLPVFTNHITRREFFRAILESIAYAIWASIEKLVDIAGIQPAELRACGGLSNSQTLMRILADVSGMEVVVPLYEEGSSVGAAICAGVGCGAFSTYSEAVDSLVRFGREYVPDVSEQPVYRELYVEWRNMSEKLYSGREGKS